MNFAQRHIGPSPAEQEQMLDDLGYASLDELTAAALPAGLIAAARPARACRPAAEAAGAGRAAPRWPSATRCSRR